MTEPQLYETLGRKQAVIEAQDAAYTNVLNLLAQVVAGSMDRTRVLVNLTDRTWLTAPEGFRPEAPATINGVPRCVVAPVEPDAERAASPDALPVARNGTLSRS